MTLVEHHIKYKEIHGEDKTVWMEAGDHIRLHRQLRKNGKCTIPAELLNKITIASRLRQKKHKTEIYYSLTGKIKRLLNGCIYKAQCFCYYLYLKTYVAVPSEEVQTYSEDEYILPDEEYLHLDKEYEEPIEVDIANPETIRCKILEIFENTPSISNNELALTLNISDRTLQRRFKELRDEGKLSNLPSERFYTSNNSHKTEPVIYESSIEDIRNKVLDIIQNNSEITDTKIIYELKTQYNIDVSGRTLSRRKAELKKEGKIK